MPVRLAREFRRPQTASVPLGPFVQGVNEKSEPHLLEFSELVDASNVVIDEETGRLKKRPGTLFKTTIPFLIDPPKRAYNFVRRDGTEILLITDDKKLVATQDLITFIDVTPIAFLTGSIFVGGSFSLEFETAEDKVWITNGVDFVFSWDGAVDSPSTSSLVAHDRGSEEITLNVGDSSSQVSDALLNRAGDGTTWIGQRVVVTAAADPNIIGFTSIVTAFNDATDTITFTPIVGLLIGDKVKVGVAIPRGRIIRYHFGTMFVGATIDNLSEIRFTDTVDPNQPQIPLTIDNPHAWPATLQLEIGLGDRLWGFSPIYRDRFATFKASGLIRIDPDPTFRFVPTVISSQIGSRFPGTWRQHNNILMFLGQDADGLPDVYMTDFTDVTHFNRKHSRTLDNLKQPSSIFRAFSIVAKSEFDAGTLSSSVSTDLGAIQCRALDSLLEQQPLVDSAFNVDMESTPGSIGLLGTVVGGEKNDCSTVLTAASPAWDSSGSSNDGESSDGNFVTLSKAGGIGALAPRRRVGVLSSTKDALLHVRARTKPGASDRSTIAFGMCNGSKGVFVTVLFRSFLTDSISVNGVVVESLEGADAFHDYILLLKASGVWKLWKDGTNIGSGTAGTTAFNKVHISAGQQQNDPLTSDTDPFVLTQTDAVDYDRIDFHPDYKGDSLDSLGGRIVPTALPSVLPLAGSITFQIDYKKALETNPSVHRYGKYHFDTILNGQSLTLESSARNRAGSSLSGFAFFNNGQEPGVDNLTPKGQKLLIRMSFLNTVTGVGSEVRSIVGGFLYLTPMITIGAEIKSWQAFQRTLLQAFPRLDIRVRRATAASLAADAVSTPSLVDETGWLRDIIGAQGNPTDADGFVNIADTQNIGTVFAGDEGLPNPPFPASRFIQVLLSGHVDSLAEAVVAGVDSMLVNWVEGSPEILPTASVILKKKWLLIAAKINSTFNDTIVVVDGNRAFVNWSGIDSNFLVWFRGKLYAGNALRKEMLQIEEGLLRDDNGPAGGGGRLVKAIPAFIVTKQEIGGEIHERKKAQAIDVAADNDVTTAITVKTQRDEESVFTAIGPILTFSPTVTHQRIRCPVGLQFKRMSLSAENAGLDQDFPLEGFILSYDRVPGRSGK